MSLIINPNAPQKPLFSNADIQQLFNDMRIIAAYREKYLVIEAGLRIDNLTDEQRNDLCRRLDDTAVELIEFIMHGANKHAPRNTAANQQITPERVKEDTQEITQ